MSIFVNVVNQKMSITSTFDNIVSGTQGFVKFRFNLSEDWDGLMSFAQFRQNGVAYNQYLDENDSVYLPSEIDTGTCTLMLYGSNENTIATTNYLTLVINDNILVEDAQSTEISTSLYNQLVTKVNALIKSNENIAELVEETVGAELNKYLESGELANLTIEDGSISRSKVDTSFETTLGKADSAMQPSVYDRQGLGLDVYEYARTKADEVQNNVDTLLENYEGFNAIEDVKMDGNSIVKDKVVNIETEQPQVIDIDTEATEESENLITSGAVYRVKEEADSKYVTKTSVKSAYSETDGNVYNVAYINALVGDIEQLESDIDNLVGGE